KNTPLAAPRGAGEKPPPQSASLPFHFSLLGLYRGVMRILVIEDDKSLGKYIVDGLKQAGHNPDLALDGMEGLGLATNEAYDVLIVDRMLPRLDGLAVIQALRTSRKNTPALVLSSLGKVEDRVEGLRAGGDDYLTKPFSFDELLARVEAL